MNLNPKLLYKWQQEALPTLPTDQKEAAEVHQLRAANKRLAQELEILKGPLLSLALRQSREPLHSPLINK